MPALTYNFAVNVRYWGEGEPINRTLTAMVVRDGVDSGDAFLGEVAKVLNELEKLFTRYRDGKNASA